MRERDISGPVIIAEGAPRNAATAALSPAFAAVCLRSVAIRVWRAPNRMI
jgi:hypothetical protein